MNTTPPLIKPLPSSCYLRSAIPSARPAHSETVTVGDLLADLPLIGITPYGLPSVLLLVGWTLLVLSLAGPFLVLVTIVVAMSVVVAVTAAVVALPYLLVRSVRGYQARRARRRRLLYGVPEHRAVVQLSRPAPVHVAVGVSHEAHAALSLGMKTSPKSWSRSRPARRIVPPSSPDVIHAHSHLVAGQSQRLRVAIECRTSELVDGRIASLAQPASTTIRPAHIAGTVSRVKGSTTTGSQ